MKQWIGIPLALLLIIGLHASAWANSELHTAGRLFFPLWDVSNPNRLTLIVVTRQAMREGASIEQVRNQWRISGNPGKCLPRGANGSTTNVNRTDLGGTAANPVRFFESKMSVRFRLLATSPGIPHALFVVHPRIPQAAREAIRANILSWPDTEQGRHILATGKFKPFVPCTDADYDIVRRYQAMVDQPGGTQQ